MVECKNKCFRICSYFSLRIYSELAGKSEDELETYANTDVGVRGGEKE